MRVNRDVTSYQAPFLVVIIDAQDSYYYADLFEDTSKLHVFDRINDFNRARVLADALFVVQNYKWNSLKEMNEDDSGYDVRVYDAKPSCVYAAHEKYKTTWFAS